MNSTNTFIEISRYMTLTTFLYFLFFRFFFYFILLFKEDLERFKKDVAAMLILARCVSTSAADNVDGEACPRAAAAPRARAKRTRGKESLGGLFEDKSEEMKEKENFEDFEDFEGFEDREKGYKGTEAKGSAMRRRQSPKGGSKTCRPSFSWHSQPQKACKRDQEGLKYVENRRNMPMAARTIQAAMPVSSLSKLSGLS